MHQRFRLVLLMLATIGSAPVALAQPPGGGETTPPDPNAQTQAPQMDESALDDDRARRHFAAGRSLLDAGRFAQAADEFEEAYRLSGRHELLYNLYVAARDASDVPRAASALERYLANVPNAPDRVNLEARLASMQERVTAEEAAAEEQRRAEEEQRRQQAELEAERARLARQRERDTGPPILGIVLVGLGGAALATSAVTGVLAMGKVNDLEDECPGGACAPGFDLETPRDEARGLVMLTDILWISGAAVAAGGLAWILFSGGDEEEEAAQPGAPPATPPVQAAAMCTTDGCGASARWSF